jgi:cytochrome oxidase Cu insertion factor (SCO1/SenC/PrrC family)
MPGMGQAPQNDDPTVVSAFHTALAHQGLVILILLAILALTWNVVRTVQYRRLAGAGPEDLSTAAQRPEQLPEPTARRVLRLGFGALWLVDGLLQLQVAMPLGMPTGVLQPSSAASRGWVQSIVNFGVEIWEKHPVQAAAATVWIQIGIGVLLLVAPRGAWSRLGGLGSVGWGLIVWVFGEAFGGIFAPGASWLFGVPGSVLLYVVAGALVVLPDRVWSDERTGRRILVGSGSFFVLMAVLQAWPGRGFWQGRTASGGGTLPQMVGQMAATPQPHAFSSLVSAFDRFDLTHGWAVNLVVVVALGATGILLCSGRLALIRVGVASSAILCVADWLLVQDLGVFGGTGTDPNSMPAFLLLIVTGYVAMRRVAAAEGVLPIAIGAEPWWRRLSGRDLRRGLAALGATGVVLVGAVPMALASFNTNADAIVAEATDGTPNIVDIPAPGFNLVDQSGHPVSLADLRGKVIALTFLDPVCTSDCPLIAQEFREADSLLGAQRDKVELVAIVTNQLYRSVAAVDAFDRQEGFENVANWLYLTGSVSQLTDVWNAYGVQEQVEPAGAMVAHTDLAYVIDGAGMERVVLDADPPAGTAGTSSFVVVLSSELQHALKQ